MIASTRRALPLLGCLAIAAMLTACATDRGIVAALERDLARDKGEELARITQVPFLLDGEVVVLPADVRDFWIAVASSDYGLTDADLTGGRPVDDQTWTLFARTHEAQAFFKNYVGPGARLIELDRPGGDRVRLIVAAKLLGWRIIAFAAGSGETP